MVGYGEYKQVGYRLRSGGVDVLLSNLAHFARFATLDDAKKFIDGGREIDGHTVYDVITHAPVAA